MQLIEAQKVSKSFESSLFENAKLLVVNDFSLSVREGELVTLFGPNGCGKTTILNLFAGTIKPDDGTVSWNSGESQSREIGYVFQNYGDTLLPWRNVRANIAFPLEIRKATEKEIEEKTARVLNLFGLSEHSDKYVYELSGGLKQLVAIARSTVYYPRLLLLDEPFSSLDYSISRMLWTRFRQFWADSKVTTIFVSHNVDEAVFLGDRVCVMSSRPTRIVAEITVPFGKERDLEIVSSQEFFSIRTQVLRAFEEGRNK
jgi:NitT/TauT family transport system ATP-binding protein